jgi:predicted transcriptional regulator
LLLENGLMDNSEDKYMTTEKGRTILEKAREINLQINNISARRI